MHFGNFKHGDWSLGSRETGAGLHGHQYRFQVLKIVVCNDRVDIRMLGEVDCSALTVMFDFNAEEPVEFT